jgi:hypothetical protein
MKANGNNNTTAYELILMDDQLGQAFAEAVSLLKSKAEPTKSIALQFLKLIENKYKTSEFILDTYELLSDAKQRSYLLKGINGK